MPRMSLLTWISLLFLAIALVGSIAVAVTRGLRAWRVFRRFSHTASSAAGAVLQTASEVDARAARLSENAARLSAAVARLQRSQAELAVIQAAANEAKVSLLAFRGFVPRK
jgi:hypothetical protein